ncbi:MAG: hypothetical protein CYPHOPRED_005774 [Cyphobasidiales sp. Tagirdzhanova-0007]|nr:MAG: hypothetical protein CYPHOPRED_005774 [Cyphobasidiales sp. Tagirdzhanova-0007]
MPQQAWQACSALFAQPLPLLPESSDECAVCAGAIAYTPALSDVVEEQSGVGLGDLEAFEADAGGVGPVAADGGRGGDKSKGVLGREEIGSGMGAGMADFKAEGMWIQRGRRWRASMDVAGGDLVRVDVDVGVNPPAFPHMVVHVLSVVFVVNVQSGGSFDVDWVITDPADTILLMGERDRQGDYIFTAMTVGEYSFCFSNDMSSFSEKLVDFDIMVETEPRMIAPAKPTSLTEQTSSLEESIYKLSGSLSSIQRTQKYFRTRDHRNRSTVASTSWRIWTFSLGESALIIAMSAFQVFVVRHFFSAPGKRRLV